MEQIGVTKGFFGTYNSVRIGTTMLDIKKIFGRYENDGDVYIIPGTLFRTKKGSENPFFLCMILFLSTGAHLSAPDACTIEKGVPPAAHFSHCTICVYFRTIYLIRQSLL